MIDYSKTIIYEIICNDLTITECYVGATVDFEQREEQHKSNCCDPTDDEYNLKKCQFIRANGGWENWTMLEIEKYPCLNKIQSRERERYYYDIRNSTLNSQRPFITDEERIMEARVRTKKSRDENPNHMKQYRIDNKTHIQENRKQYRIGNIEKINKYNEEHREETNIKGKQYRIDNKEKLRIRDTKKHVCECGRTVNIRTQSIHIKSQIHKQLMEKK